MNWFQRNFRTLIYIAFLVPILTVAVVSISHVTKWYGISNPMSWAIYLSVGIEIAALSALAAISAKMGKKVYFPFIIVTIIQFIGNIFFSYQYIDINGKSFKDWVDMVDPVVSFLGVESGNMISHKRFLALFAGGMLPLISLSFLHMLVKFEEEDKSKTTIITEKEPIKEPIEQESKLELDIEVKIDDTQENSEIIDETTFEEKTYEDTLQEQYEDSEISSHIDIDTSEITTTTTEKLYSDDSSKIKRLIYQFRNGKNK